MAVYTPGLKVASRVRHRVRRLLPIAGEVLVRQGDVVEAERVVAETRLPGDVTPVNLARALGVSPGDLADILLKKEGERVAVGDLVAKTKGIFGFFKTEYRAKVAGTLESVSAISGQMILRGEPRPVQVKAFLAGTVVKVLPNEGVEVEADCALVQGIFGVGGEAYGPIRMACAAAEEDLTAERLQPDMRGAIVIGGRRMTGDAVRQAVSLGVSALIAGGIDDQDLKDILGYDLGVAVTGSEKIGITLIITEGFGNIAMAARTFELFASRDRAGAAARGDTQIRAGVMRPEILIPADKSSKGSSEPDRIAGLLEVGAQVRVIRDPHFGMIGKVAALPHELRQLESESKARVLEVALDSGSRVTVPRANVELIET